jgi:predicted DNA-binding protein (MmcQ/YjbR family)
MNAELLREQVLNYDDVTESFPFGENTLVFKVNNKIFLLVSLDAAPMQLN